jgi:putative PIN family toxin of toxin-antitoxin system
MRSKRLVLDPNIYVSYFITGKANYLNLIVLQHRIQLIICQELLDEIERVLQYPRLQKFGINIRQFIQFIKDISTTVILQSPLKRYITEDENDDYLIALALQHSAGFVCSGDQDILSEKIKLEKQFPKLKIITKREFEEMFPIILRK